MIYKSKLGNNKLEPITVVETQELLKNVWLSPSLPTVADGGKVSFPDLLNIVKAKIDEVGANVWDTFAVFDTYKRGWIDTTQINSAFEKLKAPITFRQAVALSGADADKNGKVDIYEFQNRIFPDLSVAVKKSSEILAKKKSDELAALERFKMLDTDKNGVVTAEELEAVFLMLGHTTEEATDLMKKADVNMDGKATAAELSKV